MTNELRYAVRILAKSPGFTLVTIGTLALAIGASTALLTLIKGAYFEGLPYPRARELVTLSAGPAQQSKTDMPLSAPEFLALREQSRTLQHPSALIGGSFNLTGEGDAVRFRGLRASGEFFEMVGVPPTLGRVFGEAEQQAGEERVVVISYQLWQRALGGVANVIGRDLQLNDFAYRIIGVMPPRFRYGDDDLWVPLALDFARQDPALRNLYCHARLASNVSLGKANAELVTIGHRLNQERAAGSLGEWKLSAASLIDEVLRDVKSALGILLGAVGCVLLIACANISNLQLARNVVREKEMAIRLALGASRGDIVRQLLIESGLLAILGGIAGILLASWSLGPLLRLIPFSFIPVEAEAKLDRVVLFAALGLTTTTALLFGLLPAWKAARPELNASLKDGRSGAAGARDRRLQSGLIVAQVALTFVLLIASALMTKSFARLQDVDPRFEPNQLFKMELALPASRYANAPEIRAFYETLLTKVREIPGVQSASAANILPLAVFPARREFEIEGLPPNETSPPLAELRQVMPGYLQTLQISLERGRDFSERDQAGALPVAIVNQALASKYFPTGDALGRRLRLQNSDAPWMTIVGVVKDVRQGGMTSLVVPEIYRPHAQAADASRRMALVLRTRLDQASIVRAVRELVRAQDAGVPIFEAEPMSETITRAFGGQKLALSLLGFFGLFALCLTLIGIYGLIAYFVAQRTSEIGLRMALGAQRHHVFRLILGQGFSMVLLGLTIGADAAFAVTRVLRSLLFQVSATDPGMYVLVAFCLALAAAVASFFPARTAARLDPMQALRQE